MFRTLELTKAISNAIEISYYVAPDQPGLTPAELATVLAEFGYQPGEIQDVLKGNRSFGHGTSGIQFTEEGMPLYLKQFAIGFAEDPRDRETFAFVHCMLRDRARASRIENAKISISEITIEGQRRNLDPHQLRLAIYLLPHMGLARLDRENNLLCATYSTTTHSISTEIDNRIPLDTRPDFANMLELVRQVRALRDPEVQWQRLRESLGAIALTDRLTLDEERVLDYICTRFADTGEPVSLDEALRQMPDIEVRVIALGGLEPNFNLHTCADGRVVPSFRAIHRYMDLFRPLFTLVEQVLRTSKTYWDRQELTAIFQGHNGLIAPMRPGATTPVEVKQLRQLIELGSMQPVLALQSPNGRVQIRDEIRHNDTLARFMAGQRNAPVRSRPRPQVADVSDAEYVAFLRAALHERSKISRLGDHLSLEAITQRAKMSNAVATECLLRAQDENVIATHDSRIINFELKDIEFVIAQIERKVKRIQSVTGPSTTEEASPKEQAVPVGIKVVVASFSGSDWLS